MGFISKTVNTGKAVAYGLVDYSRKMRDINAQAERNLSGTFGNSSTEDDMNRLASEMHRIKKERNVSLRNSIRANLKI